MFIATISRAEGAAEDNQTMKQLEVYVAKRQAEFRNHAFFGEDRIGLGLREGISFAPDLTFWVMAFQDILRLNASLTRDPKIRRIVRHHRAEDAGHDRWFLDDLASMQVPAPDVRWLFGERHAPTRDAAYALMAEVHRATDDRLRLVLVKTLESAGHVFFGRVAAAVERAGMSKALKYFSFSHLEVEKNHQVFEEEIARTVLAIRLEPRARAEAKRLVDRCYAAFDSMFDAICETKARQLGVLAALAAGQQPVSVDATPQVAPSLVRSTPPRTLARQNRVRS
jgi:hypothetical protein